MTVKDADVIVVGLGAMGSMALWRLAERGVDVIGIEQFDIAHSLGSSGGQTRLFRTACFEHPSLGSIARQAQSLWRELEDKSGSELLTLTGGVMIGPADSELIQGTRAAAETAGERVTDLSHGELADRFPAHTNVDPSFVGLWDPEAGVVRPELGITSAIQAASDLSARVLTRTHVIKVEESADGVEVTTDEKTLRARSVIVAAGPWLSHLAGTPRLEPLRVIMTWFRPVRQHLTTDTFPVFIRHIDDGRTFWGHGQIDGLPVKIGAPDDPSNVQPTNPDTIDRTVHDGDLEVIRETVSRYVAGVDPQPAVSSVCMVTLSSDWQFLLGPREPGSSIILAGGCSGHAFKHAPAIGEYLAAAAIGSRPPFDGDFVNPARPMTSHFPLPAIFAGANA